MRSLAVIVTIAGFLLISAAVTAEEQDKHYKHDAHSTGVSHEVESVNKHDNHARLEETPPNVPVLLAFGAINAAFLAYGVWNKRLRKKEEAHA